VNPKKSDRCLTDLPILNFIGTVDLNNPKTFDQDFIGAHTQIEVFIGELEDV
jgi:hypothetical protein